jgi:hypothetical protein
MKDLNGTAVSTSFTIAHCLLSLYWIGITRLLKGDHVTPSLSQLYFDTNEDKSDHITLVMKSLTAQTIRDRILVTNMINHFGWRYDVANRHLPKSYTKARLLACAEQIRGPPRPDRICRRSRARLICWFLEYAPHYLAHVITSSQTPMKPVNALDVQWIQQQEVVMHSQPQLRLDLLSESCEETIGDFKDSDEWEMGDLMDFT